MPPSQSASRMQFFERYQVLILFFVALLFIAFGLKVFDIILGIHNRGQFFGRERFIMLREYAPNSVIYATPPDFYLKVADGLEKRVYCLRIDAHGLIQPSLQNADARCTIVFLGGSSTECGFVDEFTRFPYLAGKLLSEKGILVNTANAAFSGNHSLHSINILLNKILPLRPEAVVMMHNWNDLITLLYNKDYWGKGRGTIEFFPESGRPDRALLWTIDKLAPNIAFYLRKLRRFGVRGDAFAHIRNTTVAIDKASLLTSFRQSLHAFVAICRSFGIQPILMTQPSRLTVAPDAYVRQYMSSMQKEGISYDAFFHLHGAFNEAIISVGAETGTPVILLHTAVPPDREHFYDVMHLNDNGSRVAARFIAASLQPIIESLLRRMDEEVITRE